MTTAAWKTHYATAVAFTVLNKHLTRDQRAAVAVELRSLDGDDIDKRFWRTIAVEVERYGRDSGSSA